MPSIEVNGVQLYYEEEGSGTPVVFVHEFAGDCRSWEAQMRFFNRRYRCIDYNARGYPPSDVPDDPRAYSQHLHVEDLRGVLDALEIDRAHIVGFVKGGRILRRGRSKSAASGLRYPRLGSPCQWAG